MKDDDKKKKHTMAPRDTTVDTPIYKSTVAPEAPVVNADDIYQHRRRKFYSKR